MSLEEEKRIIEETKIVIDWYRRVPEEVKQQAAFRYERMKDESYADLYHTLAAAKRLSKMWKDEKR
jgi:hypothetical protein